jgi:hypothetical protein
MVKEKQVGGKHASSKRGSVGQGSPRSEFSVPVPKQQKADKCGACLKLPKDSCVC